jgi:HK97 family phage major capsid protein
VFILGSRYSGNIFSLVHRKDATSGNPLKFVVTDGTNQTFSLLSEGGTSAASVAQQPTVFSDIADTDTLISSVIFSVQEAEDAFDLTNFLNRIAGNAVLRAWEHGITLGTTNDGSNTALPNSPAGGFLQSVSAGVTQTAGQLAAGPTYAQLNSLAGSVDRSYYQNGAFMASPSVETFLRGQVSTTGKPLYKIDENTGFLLIAGRPLYPNAAMQAAGTASAPLVLFGDYSKAWNVLNAGVKMKVIANDASPTLAMTTRELIIWTRLGQSAGLNNAVKSLVSAAS